MKLNDEVTWTSQAGGYTKVKTGTIVAVVPSGARPRDHVPAGCKLATPGYSRNHESYLVRVRKQTQLYWPLVANLQPAGPTPAQKVITAAQAFRDAVYQIGSTSSLIDLRKSELFCVLRDYEKAESRGGR